jgi:glycosyltransferase involved in cell wall biosynthesis
MNENFSKPLVSVIITTYNRAYCLKKAITSAINQTYDNLEIIVLDDGSTDNTELVVKKISDSRIVYIRHQKNKGIGAARNTGIKNSKGSFIAFLDSDDEYLPEKIEKSLEVFKDSSFRTGMVASSHYKDGKSLVRPFPDKKINKKRIIPLFSTWMVRKEVFKKVGFFNEGIVITQDAEFFWRFRKKFLFNFIREPLTIKHSSADSSHASEEKILESRQQTILNLKKQKNRRLTARFLNILGKDYRGFGKVKLARKYFLKAFFTYPFNFGYFINFLKTYKSRI